MRIIELDESKPNTYSTYTRTYDELVGGKLQKPLFDFISSKAPETVDAAIPLIIKTLCIIAIVIFVIILIL